MFRTFDPYYDNDQTVTTQPLETIEQEECFICYEIKLEDKTEPIRLKIQLLYLKNCECDGVIHKKCLDIWFNLNKNCPICRNLITKNDCIFIKFMNCHKIFILTYIFYKKYIYKIKKILFIFFTTYLILEFYFNIISTKYYITDDYYHQYHNYNYDMKHISTNYIIPINISSKMNPNYHN